MFKKVSLRKIEEETPLTCYRVDYWRGIDQWYAMVSGHNKIEAMQRFRRIRTHVDPCDVIAISEMEGK